MEVVIGSVSKMYRGSVWGLRNFSLTVKTGVLGLLGPNGAGKTFEGTGNGWVILL